MCKRYKLSNGFLFFLLNLNYVNFETYLWNLNLLRNFNFESNSFSGNNGYVNRYYLSS